MSHNPNSLINNPPTVDKSNKSLVLRVTWGGLFVNVFLSIVKFIVGIVGKSQAIVADAVHSMSDLATDVAVLWGVKYWSRPADDEHPYGHHRIETIITLFIGVTLAIIGFGIGYKAIVTLRAADVSQPRWIAIWGALISIVMKEALFQWTIQVGKRTHSSAVIANAWHHRSDVLSSIPAAVAVGLAAFDPTLGFVDHIGAVIVSLFIFKVSWNIIKPALVEFSERSASKEEREYIETLVKRIDGVRSVHALRTRRFGAGYFIDLHIQVDGLMSVWQGHEIAAKVKYQLLENGPDILDVIIHVEPFNESS